jgi:prepilin-type N-terminal cleavage/methylation domain-containing protein
MSARTGPSRCRLAFTLTELLVVIAVISVLSVLTLVSIKAITSDARIASGSNAVSAALENARSLALKDNAVVLVVFRPRLDGESEQFIEVVTATFTGESYRDGNSPWRVIDRFVQSPGVPVRALPVGVKVACPAYDANEDLRWVTQAHLPATLSENEVPGVVLGVMYGPDGTTLAQNLGSDSDYLWVDFKPNLDPTGTPLIRFGEQDERPNAVSGQTRLTMTFPDDETFVTVAPFLAVYDDAKARESKTLPWNDQANYEAELTGSSGYITANADRIHFNRYTGVVMR